MITITRFIFFDSRNRFSISLVSLYVGILSSIRRKSTMMCDDCSNAFRKLFSIVRELLPLGLFISHKTPAILISVCVYWLVELALKILRQNQAFRPKNLLSFSRAYLERRQAE